MHISAINHLHELNPLLEQLTTQGFAIIDQVYPEYFVSLLRAECLARLPEFRAAAIQNGVMTQIRSDQILWLDATLAYGGQHLLALNELSTLLNREFYLGIQDIEAHFACYESGSFYALHRDNPQQKNGRQISSVYYLHETWPASGGELRLQDRLGAWHKLTPLPNRLVIFQSDLLHEVLPSPQQRLSITAWLRTAPTLW